MGVTRAPLDISPAQERRRDIRRGAACPLPENGDRARTGREAGLEKKDRRGVLYIKNYELFLKKLIRDYINLLGIN